MHTGMTSRLLAAVKSGDLDAVQHMAQYYRGRRTVERSDLGEALCLAITAGNREMIRLLVRNKAEVTYTDADGKRPIHHAAELGCVEIVRQVIQAGSPVNVADAGGASALHYAVECGNEDLVVLLLSEGANVNRSKTYKNSETPLHLASRIGRTHIIKHLIRKGGDYNMKTLDKLTPLMQAVRNRNGGVVEVLCQVGARVNSESQDGVTALNMAIDNTSVEIVRILLQYGANANFVDANGRTPLHQVSSYRPCTESHAEIAEMLLRYGADVHAQEKDGMTSLHFTGMTGGTKISALLLDHGADINATDRVSGDCPLNVAIAHSKNDVIKLLMSRGADVNKTDDNLTSPLHKLQAARNPLVYELTCELLSHGARVNGITDRGYTPLDRCVFHSVMGHETSRRRALLRLVSAGAHLHPVNDAQTGGPRHHNSPLCWLSWHGELACAKFLVDVGWDLRREKWIYLPGKNQATDDLLTYFRDLANQVRSLGLLCRLAIREHLNRVSKDTDILSRVEQLPLPAFLKQYLLLEHEMNGFWISSGSDKKET